jgi:hypothetical protein
MFPNHHFAGAPRQLRRRYRGWQRPRVALNSQTRTRQARNSQQDKKIVNGNVKELLTRVSARQFCLLNACAPAGRRSRIRDPGCGRVIGTGPHAANDPTLVAAVSVMGGPMGVGSCPASHPAPLTFRARAPGSVQGQDSYRRQRVAGVKARAGDVFPQLDPLYCRRVPCRVSVAGRPGPQSRISHEPEAPGSAATRVRPSEPRRGPSASRCQPGRT